MAKKERNPEVIINGENVNSKLEDLQLEYVVNTAMSTPRTDRFRDKYKGMNIFEVMTVLLSGRAFDDMVIISTGSYAVELSKEGWLNWLAMSCELFTAKACEVTVNSKDSTTSDKPDFSAV